MKSGIVIDKQINAPRLYALIVLTSFFSGMVLYGQVVTFVFGAQTSNEANPRMLWPLQLKFLMVTQSSIVIIFDFYPQLSVFSLTFYLRNKASFGGSIFSGKSGSVFGGN